MLKHARFAPVVGLAVAAAIFLGGFHWKGL